MMIDLKMEKNNEIVGEFLESVAGCCWLGGGCVTSYHSFRYRSHPLFLLARFPCLRLPIFRNLQSQKKSQPTTFPSPTKSSNCHTKISKKKTTPRVSIGPRTHNEPVLPIRINLPPGPCHGMVEAGKDGSLGVRILWMQKIEGRTIECFHIHRYSVYIYIYG